MSGSDIQSTFVSAQSRNDEVYTSEVREILSGRLLAYVCGSSCDEAHDRAVFISDAINAAVRKPGRPPLGLRPRYVAVPMRIAEIVEAMRRFSEDGTPIPREWTDELRDLSAWLEQHQNTLALRA